MKIRDLIENLQACDPEAEVLLSLEFNRANLDPDQILPATLAVQMPASIWALPPTASKNGY